MKTAGARYRCLLLALGLFVRMMLMPFTLHHDLLCTARRSALLIFNNAFLLPYWSELTYTGILYPFKAALRELPTALPLDDGYEFSVIPGQEAYNTFLASPTRFRLLFLLKLPFLITDLVLLLFIHKKLARNTRNYFFWAFNPLLLYGVYMWGRYEIFSVLFATLSIYLAKDLGKKNRAFWTLVTMSLAAMHRTFFIIYLPVLFIYLYRDKKDLARLPVIPACLLLLGQKLLVLFGGGTSVEKYINTALAACTGEGFHSTSPFIVAFFSNYVPMLERPCFG